MVHRNIPIPDELDAKLRSHVERFGGDVDAFIARAIAEQLEAEDDVERQRAIAEKIKRGADEIARGEGIDAHAAKEQLRRELGFPDNP